MITVDTITCEKCGKKAEEVATVSKKLSGEHYILYVCEDGHETKVSVSRQEIRRRKW